MHCWLALYRALSNSLDMSVVCCAMPRCSISRSPGCCLIARAFCFNPNGIRFPVADAIIRKPTSPRLLLFPVTSLVEPVISGISRRKPSLHRRLGIAASRVRQDSGLVFGGAAYACPEDFDSSNLAGSLATPYPASLAFVASSQPNWREVFREGK